MLHNLCLTFPDSCRRLLISHFGASQTDNENAVVDLPRYNSLECKPLKQDCFAVFTRKNVVIRS